MSRNEEFHGGRNFEVVPQEMPSGLEYHRTHRSNMKRMAIVDPDHPIHQASVHLGPASAESDYFSPEINMPFGKGGKKLKNPKRYSNPNVVNPHTVAFVDYHQTGQTSGEAGVYIDFVRSRQRGHGHARRLIEEVANQHPDAEINFGKVMNEGIWKVKEDLEQRGRRTRGNRYF
jgi:hypothetical protein